MNTEQNEFLFETAEIVKLLESIALSVSKENFIDVKKVFMQKLHNIKGTAGMLELDNLTRYAHHCEDMVSAMQFDNKSEVTLLYFCDEINKFIEANGDYIFPSQISPSFSTKNNSNPSPPEVSTEASKHKPAKLVIPKLKTKVKVAYIEDEEDLLDIVKVSLEKVGFEVDGYSSANSFLELTESKRRSYHLILTDKNLPGITGVELIKRVKQSNPLIPIIMISGFLDEEAIKDCAQYGISGYIPKPFERNVLLQLSISKSLEYLNRQLLERLMKVVNYKMGSILFDTEVTQEDINYITKNIRDINFEMIQIKKYFSQLTPVSSE